VGISVGSRGEVPGRRGIAAAVVIVVVVVVIIII
jgi:hypothetical protein